jgi:hypothetical protein
MARRSTWRFVWRGLLIFVLLIVADFQAASLADRTLRNRDQFFETIVAGADLAYKPWKKGESSAHVECAWHRVLLVYWARTCFGRDGSRNPELYGDQDLIPLNYWRPLPLSMLWLSDMHFDAPGREMILSVTRKNEIVRDLRNE